MADVFDEVAAPPKDVFDEVDQGFPTIKPSPYEEYKVSHPGPMTQFGPPNPQELLALPQLLKAPAAAMEQSGIMSGIGEVAADFLRRTGINPAAQSGVSLAPTREQETYIPSPLEEAFPNVGRGLEETARSFVTPENLALAPFAGLKPVQKAFEAQMAAGIPESVEQAVTAPTTQERTQAAAQAILGGLAAKHLIPKAEEAPPSVASGPVSMDDIRKMISAYRNNETGEVFTSNGPGEGHSKFADRLGISDLLLKRNKDLDKGLKGPWDISGYDYGLTDAIGTFRTIPELDAALKLPPSVVAAGESPEAPSVSAAEVPVAAGAEPAKVEPNVTPEVTQVEEPIPLPQGPGARTMRVTPETPESYEGTGLKNAIGEVERASHGLPEATPTERRNMGAAWIRSGEAVANDPTLGFKLVQQLQDNPNMGLTDDQSALLLRHKVRVENDINDAAERTFTAESEEERVQAMAVHAAASDHLLTILDLAKASGERWGREGRWRQAIAKEDYSFASMESKLRVSKGGASLSDTELSDLKKQHAEIQDKLAASEKREQEARAEAAMAKAAADSVKTNYHPKVIEAAKRVVETLDKRADAARLRLKEKFARTSAGLDPTILKDVAEIGVSHLARGIVDFAEWSGKMVGEFGEKVKPYLQDAFTRSKQMIDGLNVTEPIKRVIAEGTPEEQKQSIREAIAQKVEKGDNEISFFVQKLARLFYSLGIRDRDAMVRALHEELKKAIPDITERQTADAFSGYGDYKQLSKDDVTVALRGMKGELQQLAKLEDMASGKPPSKSGVERRTPTDIERELVKRVNDAKFKFQIPVEDPETQLKSALDTLKTTLATRIKDYQKRLAEGDFAVKTRRELVLDREAIRLRADAERAKQDFQKALEANRRANRTTWQKALDKFVKVERFFKLSSPAVFLKLASAALTRGVTTAAEETTGGALGLVPGIATVARQAPREGGLNITAMAKGLADALSPEAFRQSIKKAKTGETDIEVLHSKKGSIDRDWTNLMGQLHGALKTPVMLGEYRLSLEKRISQSIETGVDVSSPEVLTRLQAEAMDDAYRSIFMQRGFTSDWFNTALTIAEKNKSYPVTGEVAARVARFLLPVVRVPLNIVGESVTGAVGIPVASTRLMFHAVRGTLDSLDPKTADSIMRQFKKGSIGLGLMAIGYLNPQAVGGFDYREKRQPGAVKTAGFQIGGVDIPRWATHAPWFELMQIGATIRHVQDEHTKEGTKGVSEGMWAAGWGLVDQTPFFDQMTRWVRASESADARTRFLGELAKGTVVPQAVSQAAAVIGPEKVKPKTVAEYVESGIPGLRGNIGQESPYK